MSKKNNIELHFLDPDINEEMLEKVSKGKDFVAPNETPLVKSIVNTLNGRTKIARLAFEEDPSTPNRYGGIFYDKISLIPDRVLKRIAMVDDLIAAILIARANQASQFGNVLANRFSIGFRIEPDHEGEFSTISAEEKKDILSRAVKATKILYNCGSNQEVDSNKMMNLPTFLYLSARNACLFGRFATEIIHTQNLNGTEKKFHSFRPADPGTIYRVLPNAHAVDKIRKQALRSLQELNNQKLKPEKFSNDEYSWVQVIEGIPQQAFTDEEMIVHNCYPVTDIELNGYPLTPVDTALAAITTHINITTHNKLYFQAGRAARGMLLIKSDDVDPSMLADLKQQFNAAINNVSNSWKMPVIKVGKEDSVEWHPIDNSSRDMEFQYLSDSNARVILSAFQMSPEELPGYAHLARGTNSQALSETSNEWKLEAARDVGIRPLLYNLQEFLNSKILPLIDEKLSKYCSVKFHGLEAETAEKETTRLGESSELYGTYDDICEQAEKEQIGIEWGGRFPLNPGMQAILDRYFTVGEIKEHFFGIKDASKQPELKYFRDAFYFQNIQLVMQQKQMDEQKKMAEQQLQAQQQQGQQQQAQGTKSESEGNDLNSGIDQLIQMFSKSEDKISLNKKKLLAQHDAIVNKVMKEWDKESEKLLVDISNLVEKNKKDK